MGNCSFGGSSSSSITMGGKSSVTFNGKTYQGAKSISVCNGVVTVDGVVQKPETKVKDLGDLSYHPNQPLVIQVTGDAHVVESSSGDVHVGGNVSGSVSTSNGDIHVKGDVGGNASTSNGNITADYIEGSGTTTMGNIKYVAERKKRKAKVEKEPVVKKVQLQ